MKKVSAIFLVFLFGISIFSGCGGNTAIPDGKYALTECEMFGDDFLAQIQGLSDSEDYDRDDLYLELRSDGTFQMALYWGGSGTFKISGKNITLTGDGGNYTTGKGTINNGQIVLNYNVETPTKLVFEKK